MASRARSGQPINWVTVVSACLVSIGLTLLMLGLFRSAFGADPGPATSAGGVEITAERFNEIRQIPHDELDAYSDEQFTALLDEIDVIAEQNLAPAGAVETEALRIQSAWESSWYSRH